MNTHDDRGPVRAGLVLAVTVRFAHGGLRRETDDQRVIASAIELATAIDQIPFEHGELDHGVHELPVSRQTCAQRTPPGVPL
ncbi:hypothetical protein ACWGE0_03530 [Lentzea sp. NPDC054927]